MPAYELVRLRLDEVSPTPLNPRRNFGTEEEQTRFGEELRVAQLAACVAVTRAVYLKLWPDHEERIGEALYVLVNGERRFRSAVHVGLEALDFVVRDDLASSREEFVDHLLKENLDREDFDVIERARGVQQLVDVCAEENERGARARAAERLKRDRSWVTNQLVLLELPEKLQKMLSSGEVSERNGRLMARRLREQPELTSVQLLDHLKAVKDQEEQKREEEQAILRAARDSGQPPSLLSADNRPVEPPPATSAEPARSSRRPLRLGPPQPAPAATTAGVSSTGGTPVDGSLSADNEQMPQIEQPAAPGEVPWGDPAALHELLLKKMSPADRTVLAQLLLGTTAS
ncbi:plasmid partitioning protein [Streptomyces sp. 8K308]|uniref:ParB/RepB/Spo0J family partition protein n=1 Tax=Streptomyces sp. 8K308 TaxID=2530388 RepID=UPI001A9EA72A|nr:plasmid partitioning protein [Streptomyces sp. 8K308]